jgi:hypothetical protein
MQTCKNCGNTGNGKYCGNCGQSYSIERVTLHHLLEEVFHFFTHFEKGFGYTLKQLIFFPGIMQKKYLEGHRVKFQKPFSMFFICATVCGLSLYWINSYMIRQYKDGEEGGLYFFHHYFVITHICLLPVYSLVLWLLFKQFRYNYAEMLVVTLYNMSFFFLLIIPVNVIRFIYNFDTRYIEVIIISVYNVITLLNLFKEYGKRKVVLLSFISIIINYAIAQAVQIIIIEKIL